MQTRTPSARGLLALAAATLTAALVPAGAQAYKSTFQASPHYPESTLAQEVKGKPRARGIVNLVVSGYNASRDDGDGLAFDYTLDVYVMDRKVFKDCPQSLDEMNSRIINLPGKVEWIGQDLNVPASGPFSTTITYKAESFRKLLYCAYTTYVVDDVAVSTLKHDLRKAKRRKR